MSTWDESDPAAIAFLFVACARTADGELAEAEVVRIVERIAAWMPGASIDELHEILARAVELFGAAPDPRALHELVHATSDRLAALLAVEERERLVTELIGLSYADGQVDIGETDFVLAVAKILDVEVALADD
ncbi:TerB family tellurite resistance protein [Pseudenhygromyxa sp. WMMC2535]|uniref:TerB family tellurite resistance protein n=1 Tax=Pseudenhygromyxa sp. WMMC2535 TaxID=2712867 RepID=UPI001553D925|nr:TerB family tellurite resistance protein [Pseudenhygromyxa sp. WMMC2535]NVB40475.1 TerB family tellurite resistance protein [Pseudenhygromyxa sp. WMMC2535]